MARRGWKRLSTLIHEFCCAGNEIAAEEWLKVSFWTRLNFLMVGSWRLLSAGINTKERPAAMSKMFLVDKTLPEAQRTQGIESVTWMIFFSQNNFKLISVRNMIQVIDSIPWVRCASGNVSTFSQKKIYFLQLFSNFFSTFFSIFFQIFFSTFSQLFLNFVSTFS